MEKPFRVLLRTFVLPHERNGIGVGAALNANGTVVKLSQVVANPLRSLRREELARGQSVGCASRTLTRSRHNLTLKGGEQFVALSMITSNGSFFLTRPLY